MKSISIKNLKPETFYDAPLMLDGKYIILAQETPLTAALIKRLAKWGYRHVYTEGPAEGRKTLSLDAEGNNAGSFNENLKEKEDKEKSHKFYMTLLQFVQKLFDNFKEFNAIHKQGMTDQIKITIEAVKKHRKYLLRLGDLSQIGTNDYMVAHAAKSLILALTIGIYLKYPPHRLIELGTGALLHEIGVFKLPKELYTSSRIFTPKEKQMITTHTILGFRILKEQSFTSDVAVSALEHHERLDGSGYPKSLSGEAISEFAKIIGLCCAYDAQISKRPHRTGRDGHSCIVDMLKDMGKLWDEKILKALVYSISIYPLGSYILLNTNEIAVVIEANDDNPRFPVVKVLVNSDGNRIADNPVIKTYNNPKIKIKGVLSDRDVKKLRDQGKIT